MSSTFGFTQTSVREGKLRILLAPLLALTTSLAACNSPETPSDTALAYENASRIAALEAEVERLREQLESEAETRSAVDDAVVKDFRTAEAALQRIEGNQSAFRAHINYLRALHGRPEIPEKTD